MTEKYTIRLKNLDFEIEVSGEDKLFVSENFDKIIKNIEKIDLPVRSIPNTPIISEVRPIKNHESVQTVESKESLTKKIGEDLSEAAWITLDDLKNIYHFSDGSIIIHQEPKAKAESDKHQVIARLALIAHLKINNNENGLSGKAIWKYLSDLGIGWTWNLSANLRRNKWIKKVKSMYMLNQIWIKDSLALVRELSQIT